MFELVIKSIRKRRLLFLVISAYFVACLICAFATISLSAKEDRQQPFVVFFMSEMAMLLFVVPLLPVNRTGSEGYSIVLGQLVSGQASSARIAIGIFRFPLLMTIVLCLIPGLLALFIRQFSGGIPAIAIIRTSLVVMTIAVFALSIGFYASIVCRDRLSAAGFALLLVILICTEPIWFGPVINFMPDVSALIRFSLLMNPFVGVASSLNFDILRIDPFYQICPIGQLRFSYPASWLVALFNLSMAAVVLWRSAAGIRRMSAPSI